MSDVVCLFIALLTSGLYLWLFLNATAERAGFDWIKKPSRGAPAGCLGFIVVLAALLKADMGVLTIFLLMALWIPCGLVFFPPFAYKAVDLVTGAGALGLKNLPTFDQAQAAERRGLLDQAEELFLETLRIAREKDFTEEELAEAFLAYGNLLHRLDRLPEAADWWERAAPGNLLADRAQVTALRAADARLALGEGERARKILLAAVQRHPREPTTKTLRRRLDGLLGESGQTNAQFPSV